MTRFYSDDYVERIPIKDNNEPLVDLEKYVKRLIIRKKSVINKKIKKILVRKTIAKMLKDAEKFLPKGYNFIIYDGYREEKIQKTYFTNHFKKLRQQHPNWPEKRLRKIASNYVADPKRVCPHLTGGAIDITIGKRNRIATGGFNLYKEKNISEKFMKNRQFLAKIMKNVGFANYAPEWWHWSYGDRHWAAVKKKKFALYKEIRK